ncbi:uncharacterized protein LOC130697040 [Daphnia carinata]|uniref:uncharacterized protein LOC130697040 n=1 Tax=Daphnia carinata TaxID=120202 RepID=UPI002868A526|nr:uncharacterized protein LOC130697040 [Daphnia carinata]
MTANEESASSTSVSENSFQTYSEDEAGQTEIPSDSITVVWLKQGHGGDNSQSWWNKRKQRIFRKKTLYMRIPILKWLPKYSAQDFVADLVAGITVGVTVIPQGLAYATVARLPPEYGLHASYVGCFVYLLFGGTPVVTIGPTALMSLVTYDSGAALMGPEAAILLAFLTGCIVLLFGLLNFGFLIDITAAPVVAEFTSAAAFTIATTQIEAFPGLRFDDEGFLNTWIAVFENIAETKKWDAVLGFASIAILLLLRVLDQVKLGEEGERKRWQNWVNTTCWLISVSRNAIVIIAASILAYALAEPGQSSYPLTLTGEIPSGFPPFRAPPFSFEADGKTYSFVDICKNLGSLPYISPLVTVTESIAIAKSLAKGSRTDVSQEMIAIGTSNILGSFTSSFPVTGAFPRTVVNAASGVHTPFDGLYTGALALLAITVLTPYFFYIPKNCLAAVIISAVIFMVEVSLVKMVWKSKKIVLVPFGFTFVFCVFVGLSQGILIGTAINLGMLLYSTARPRIKIHKIKFSVHRHGIVHVQRTKSFGAISWYYRRDRHEPRLGSGFYHGLPPPLERSPEEQTGSSEKYNDEEYAISPSACLLRQASLSPEPEDGDKDVDVDLYQAAVLSLARLDRLAAPFIHPPLSDRTVIENTLIRLDLNASTTADRYTEVHKLSIAIEQMICTALGLLILSSDDKVYIIGYTDPEPTIRILKSFSAFSLAGISFMADSCVCVILMHAGQRNVEEQEEKTEVEEKKEEEEETWPFAHDEAVPFTMAKAYAEIIVKAESVDVDEEAKEEATAFLETLAENLAKAEDGDINEEEHWAMAKAFARFVLKAGPVFVDNEVKDLVQAFLDVRDKNLAKAEDGDVVEDEEEDEDEQAWAEFIIKAESIDVDDDVKEAAKAFFETLAENLTKVEDGDVDEDWILANAWAEFVFKAELVDVDEEVRKLAQALLYAGDENLAKASDEDMDVDEILAKDDEQLEKELKELKGELAEELEELEEELEEMAQREALAELLAEVKAVAEALAKAKGDILSVRCYPGPSQTVAKRKREEDATATLPDEKRSRR